MIGPLKYSYESVFAPHIEGLVLQKKSCGFIYDFDRTYSKSLMNSALPMDILRR